MDLGGWRSWQTVRDFYIEASLPVTEVLRTWYGGILPALEAPRAAPSAPVHPGAWVAALDSVRPLP